MYDPVTVLGVEHTSTLRIAVNDRRVLDAGVAYLQKPASPDDLAAKVRDVLGQPRAAGVVLVVDDEAGIRGLFSEILQSAGYEVLEAENGKRAIRMAADSTVDLVITDLVMPEQEGIETIVMLRKDRPHLKIIAMSGAAFGDQYLGVARKLGADTMLAKPIRPDQLLETVRQVLSEL
jgi:DNA-binding response OmpR family regulator